MTDVAVQSTLSELAAVANREHQAAGAAGRSFLLHALAAGDALTEAKRLVPYGQWTAWVDANFMPPRTDVGRLPTDEGTDRLWLACQYMRLAEYRVEVEASGARSVNAAVAEIRGLPMRRGRDEALHEQIRDLKASGLSQRQIAAAAGCSRTSVQSALRSPEATRRRLEQGREKNRRRRAERRALAELEEKQRIKRTLSKANAALAEAYSQSERLQDVLGRAHAQADDGEARRALARAGEHYRKMRDEIVEALGAAHREKQDG